MPNPVKYLAIAVVCVALGAGGFWLYQDRQRSGIDISVGGSGVSIQTR